MKMFVAALAAASMVATPAAASVREAAFATSADRARAETSMFIGVNYGVSLDRKTNMRKPRAALTVARMVKTPNAQFRVGEGIGLTTGAKGKPALLFGGRDIVFKDKANMSDGATVGIVVVGVLAIGAAAAYFALRDECDYKECE